MTERSGEIPPSSHRAEWRAYWKAQGQPWRRDPLIAPDRQDYLASLKMSETNFSQFHFPFKDVRLYRADIEWLLATHQDKGPVDWSDEGQHERVGLDLSGAILSKVDLRGLPLARLRGGIGRVYSANDEQREAAAVRLDGANLMEALLEGADLRYAHLERANLSGANLEGADLSYAHLERAQLVGATLDDATLFAANLYRANLGGARLERAELGNAFLRQADLQKAQLKDATLRGANLEQAILIEAHLEQADLGLVDAEGAILSQAHLARATFNEGHFEGAILSQANLRNADLWRAVMVGAVFFAAQLEGANLTEAQLDGAVLMEAHLQHASLRRASLRGADLRGARLESTDLRDTHLEGITLWTVDPDGRPQPPVEVKANGNEYWVVQADQKCLPTDRLCLVWRFLDHFPAVLPPADLRLAFMDSGTRLNGAILCDQSHGSIRVADTHWNGANLSVINWDLIKKVGLGDQQLARQRKKPDGRLKTRAERLVEYGAAIRANRQLSIALLNEGLDEISIRFTAHTQPLEEVSLWWQGQIGDLAAIVLLNRFADLLAGYGYKPLRSIASYLLVVFSFALAYALLGPAEGYHYSFWGWLVLSVTSFHGRGLFPAPLDLEKLITRLQAFEAVCGLFVEVSLIAIYTRRFFFGK